MRLNRKVLLFVMSVATFGATWFYVPWLEAKPPLGGFKSQQLVSDARSQIGVTTRYDPEYTSIPYPNGDVALFKGVCTDVVIRAMRGQGVDLQTLVHQDMRQNFSKYPKRWGLKKADANIDHRRVLNLEVFMQRRGASLPLSDFQAGDWVTWRVGDKNLPHIGLVSNRKFADGTPLIIHNIGAGTQEEMFYMLLKWSGIIVGLLAYDFLHVVGQWVKAYQLRHAAQPRELAFG